MKTKNTNKDKNDIFVAPVKKYAPPKYPTQTEVKFKPELLKKLPPRWQKNAAVVAAVGMLGSMTLTSCGTPNSNNTGVLPITNETYETADIPMLRGTPAPSSFTSEHDADFMVTSGDDTGELAGDVLVTIPSEQKIICVPTETETETQAQELTFINSDDMVATAGAPAIISYFSEQDALAIIKSMAESEGLNFESDLPEDIDAGIKLYDAEKQVAVEYNSYGYTDKPEESYVTSDGTSVGVFYKPETEEYADNKQQLEENLREQVRDFIEWLQGQGII